MVDTALFNFNIYNLISHFSLDLNYFIVVHIKITCVIMLRKLELKLVEVSQFGTRYSLKVIRWGLKQHTVEANYFFFLNFNRLKI